MNELTNPKNITISLVTAWFISALILGYYGFFNQNQPKLPPINLAIFLFLPIFGFITAYFSNKNFKAFTHRINLTYIVGAHTWRYVGIGFVAGYYLGFLPPQFSFPEGIGDIISAIFALPLAFALSKNKRIHNLYVAWNIFGLIDLISAVTVGVLYSQGSFGILRTGLSTAVMTNFPINLIPTFFVPLFILLHLLALARHKEVK